MANRQMKQEMNNCNYNNNNNDATTITTKTSTTLFNYHEYSVLVLDRDKSTHALNIYYDFVDLFSFFPLSQSNYVAHDLFAQKKKSSGHPPTDDYTFDLFYS